MASGNVKLTVQLSAQDKATKTLKAAGRAIKDNTAAVGKATTAQAKASAQVDGAIRKQGKYTDSLNKAKGAIGGFVGKLSSIKGAIAAAGVLAAAKAFGDFAKAGELAANVATRFEQAVPGYSSALEAATRATAGLVEATDLQTIYNRFVRLGVPVRDTTRLLELATKAAVDQHRSVLDVAKILETAVRGETTALMEIGVNIDETGRLVAAYAEETGRATAEIDKMEARLKVALPAALKALGDQFDAVDLSEFRLQIQQTETMLGDLVSKWQVNAAIIFNATAEALTPADASLKRLVENLGRASKAHADHVKWLEKNKDETVALWMAEGGLEKRAASLHEAMLALNDRLRAMKPEDRVAGFNALGGAMSGMTAEAQKTATAMFRLDLARRELSGGGKWDMLGGLSGGGEWFQKLISKAEAGKLKASKAAKGRAGAGAGLDPARAAAMQAIRDVERLGALKAQVRAAETLDDLKRAEIEHEAKIEAINISVRNIQDATIRDDIASQQRRLADLGLEKEIARIKKEVAETQERERQRGKDKYFDEEDRKKREALRKAREQADLITGGISGALGEAGSILGELDSQLAALGRPDRYTNIIKGFGAIGAQVGRVGTVIAEWGKTSRTASEDTAAGVEAGLGVVGAGVASFVSGTAEKAGIMSAFELAMGIATLWMPTGESVSHFTAAAMFAAMAGVAAAQPSTPAAGAAAGGAAGGAAASGGGSFGPGAPIRPEEAEAKNITINLQGTILGTAQELGRSIAEQIDSMSGTGMQATAF